MIRSSSLTSRRWFARLAVWAMVALVPLQAIAGAVLGALGPLHTHRATTQAVVLEDFRRAVTPAPRLPRHVATAFGHFHEVHDATPERHRHVRGDSTVVDVDDGSASLDAENASAGATLAAAVALCAEPVAWQAAEAGHARASGAAWAPLSHDPPFPERPPRAG